MLCHLSQKVLLALHEDSLQTVVLGEVASPQESGCVIPLDMPCAVQLLGEDAAKTTIFARYLREVFHPTTEPVTMEVAAATLGHLVRSGGAPTADIVETELHLHVCRACSLFRGRPTADDMAHYMHC